MRQTVTYGGRLERLFAYLLDTIFLLIPTGFVAGMLQTVSSSLGLVGVFCCSAAYYTLFTASRWQATPGKRLLNLRVVRTDGQLLGKEAALERFLAYCLPNLPIYASFIPVQVASAMVCVLSLYWFVPIITTPERIGVHDRLCRTRVIVGK